AAHASAPAAARVAPPTAAGSATQPSPPGSGGGPPPPCGGPGGSGRGWGPTDTWSWTAVPAITLLPAAGVVPATVPFGASSEYQSLPWRALRPASRSTRVACSTDIPMTDGTSTFL